MIRELLQGVSHLLYPRLCEGCCKPLVAGEKVLCLACSLELPETHYHDVSDNETALRFAGRIPFAHATSLAWFTNEGLLQHLVHGLKYKGREETGHYLGSRLGHCIGKTSWASSIDVIIPVPLHPAKLASRGYNQSTAIAGGIGKALRRPVADYLLTRTRNTESQTHKSRVERTDNMKDAFGVSNPILLRDKHVLLCDDVLTTGATLEACANTLFKVESIKISIATIGIAVS